MISVQNLGKRYGALEAVSDVCFEVKAGEIVGLLGQNGAGKTTIMKILTGFLEPTAGSVSVDELDVCEHRIEVQKMIGYLPENAPLYPEMLVQEYLKMMADLRGIPEREQRSRISAAVRATGLEERLVQPIGTLSKGYRQRVGLAQAILHRPKVLVLDEPTNGLDPVQILEIRELILELAKDTTIILSTHILQEIEAVCDRVVVLINGHLATDTLLEDLLRTNVVRLAVDGEAKDVTEKVGAVEGVERVEEEPTRDGVSHYRIHCADGTRPAAAVAKVALDAGWELSEVATERPSLESVFRDLMDAHISKMREEAAA